MIAMFDTETGGFQIAMALGILGQGMGFAMSPATDAIMGALPPANAGIGSAMNDVVREVGGTLGIAVLGSILTSGYGSGMDDATAGLLTAALLAAGAAVVGALIALAFLPSRAARGAAPAPTAGERLQPAMA